MKKIQKRTPRKHTTKTEIKLYSFDEVFKKSKKNKAFQRAYEEGVVRLRLARQLRFFRDAKRLTQKAVAEKTGMPQSVIARIESGERGLTIDTLGKIANALGKEIQLV